MGASSVDAIYQKGISSAIGIVRLVELADSALSASFKTVDHTLPSQLITLNWNAALINI